MSRFMHLWNSSNFRILVNRVGCPIRRFSDRKFSSRVLDFQISNEVFWFILILSENSVRVARSKKQHFYRLRIHLGGSNLEVKNKSPEWRRWALGHWPSCPMFLFVMDPVLFNDCLQRVISELRDSSMSAWLSPKE